MNNTEFAELRSKYWEKYEGYEPEDPRKDYARPKKHYDAILRASYHEIGHVVVEYIFRGHINSVIRAEVYPNGGGNTIHDPEKTPCLSINPFPSFRDKLEFDRTFFEFCMELGGMVAEWIMCREKELNYEGAGQDIDVLTAYCYNANIPPTTMMLYKEAAIDFLCHAFLPYAQVMDELATRLYKKGAITGIVMQRELEKAVHWGEHKPELLPEEME